MEYTDHFINQWNSRLRSREPQDIVQEALGWCERPVVTTNFRPYEVALLHLVSTQDAEIPVIWCDTGYNTPETYRHADDLIRRLKLNTRVYVPRMTSAYRAALSGGIPTLEDPLHEQFTEEVKLEPFRRAMNEWQPDLWFTNLRKGQTPLRDRLDILSLDRAGRLKVSPFYYYSDRELDEYLKTYDLPNEFRYFDPTKVESSRECGLHT